MCRMMLILICVTAHTPQLFAKSLHDSFEGGMAQNLINREDVMRLISGILSAVQGCCCPPEPALH